MKANNYYSLLLYISTFISIMHFLNVRKKTNIFGTGIFSLFFLAVAFYSFGYANEILCSNIEQIKFWLKVEYIGISFLPALWIILSMQLNSYGQYINIKLVASLLIIPCLTLFFMYTNDLHKLFYSDLSIFYNGYFYIVEISKGPWYHVNSVFQFFSLFVGSVLFSNGLMQASNLFRNQKALMFLGSTIVCIGFIIYYSGNSPYGFDLLPFCFFLTGIILMLVIYKYKILDIMPIALSNVFEGMREGVIILDRNNILVNYNNSAKDIFNALDIKQIGKQVDDVFQDNTNLIKYVNTLCSEEKEISLQANGNIQYYKLTISNVLDSNDNNLGKILLFNDITKQKELINKLDHIASIDHLTKIFSRRHFLKISNLELEKAKEKKYPVSFIIFDFDYFKNINDTYGHDVGDLVLSTTADLCLRIIKNKGIIGRLGGEEFAIFLFNVSFTEAAEISEELRKEIENYSWKIEGQVVKITASFGVVVLNTFSEKVNLGELIKKADKLLYKAKDNGRNNVEIQMMEPI